MNSAAVILPPTDLVKSRSFCASSGFQTPEASRVPGLVENDVTICASTACAKSTTPFHCWRLKTPLNPGGGVGGALSESAKYVVLAHVPLTRTYAGRRAAASFRRRAFVRSIGGRYS